MIVETPEVDPEAEPADAMEVRLLGLRETLDLALKGNRGYQTRLEDLYLTALGLTGTRHAFSPRLSAVLSYFFATANDAPADHDASLGLGLDKILPWGGTLSLSADTGFADDDLAGPGTFDTGLSIQLTQPLLRGAGHEVSHEALTQAERGMIYEIRDFELFREDFSIEVAERFYGLVAGQQSIRNQKENLERATFDRRKAEAFFDVGRVNELEVLRARRQELSSQNDLLEAEEGYREQIDRFRIFLGLPEEEVIDVLDEPPVFVPVTYDVDSAVQVALANRLDVLTERQRLEDSERALRIAKNGLLPDLDFTAQAGLSSLPDGTFSDQELDQGTVSAGITFGLPVDRVLERNAYRSAMVQHDRAERGFEEFLDSVVIEVRAKIRELVRREESVRIQRELIRDQERNQRIAALQFERGEVSNREVVETEQALLEARNSLIREQVDYEIARLRLLRDLGILFIDEQGMWKE